jgi:phosphoribosylformylglycinamidine synthase subunit PurL
VVGGNVSLYNETEEGPIYPTPIVGLVGELPAAELAVGLDLRDGDEIVLVGPFAPSLAGSELAKLRGELGMGLPRNAIGPVAESLELVRELVRDGAARAAHDISDGGLACAIGEMAIAGGVGARIDLDPLIDLRGCAGETALFGEGPGGILFAMAAEELDALNERAARTGVDVLRLGQVGGERLEIAAAERDVSVPLAQAEDAWRSLDLALQG